MKSVWEVRGGIGEVIGLDGSTIHYYYPTKADLLSAMFERMAVVQWEWTEETLSMLPEEGRALSLVEHVFSASLDRPRVAKLLNALSYAAEKGRDLRRRLKRIYRSLDEALLAEFEKSFPNAPLERRQAMAYAIASLGEGAAPPVTGSPTDLA